MKGASKAGIRVRMPRVVETSAVGQGGGGDFGGGGGGDFGGGGGGDFGGGGGGGGNF